MLSANTRVNISFVLAIVLGCFIGWEIAFFKEFKFYKLVNITGLFYDLIAVVLLSYTFFLKDSVKAQIAHFIALIFVVFSSTLPAAISGGMYLASLFGGGNIEGLKSFIYFFVAVSIVPSIRIYTSPVLEPVGSKSYEPTKRLQILGGVLLFMGFAFQIIAAFADFLENA